MSMFPHTVTVYNATEDPVTFKRVTSITILKGVFFDAAKAANVRASGLESADAVNLIVPFDVVAVDGVTGEPKEYISPKRFEDLVDTTGFWTLRASSATENSCFFVKGEVVEPDRDFQYINQNYDDVYRVNSVDEKDFGNLKHWAIGGR